MSGPLVSVVVPVYNRHDVVRRAVESLLTQRFGEAYEIVVVDDGSTDGSADAIEGISPLVRVVRQQNAGAAAARRAGIVAARGEHVAFLDSDDVAEPWHLDEHWKALRRRQDVVLSFARVSDMSGTIVGRHNLQELLSLDSQGIVRDALSTLISAGCVTASMNLLTYRSIALKAAAPRYDVPASNDYAFALQVARQGAFAYIDRYTIRCERRDDGIGRRRPEEQFAYSLIAMRAALYDSGRRDYSVWKSFERRVGDAWPSAAVAASRSGHWLLAARLLGLGMRHGLRRDTLRRSWWALVHQAK